MDNVYEFLARALGELFMNEPARTYMMKRVGKRKPVDIPDHELQQIIAEALRIAIKDENSK